MGKEDKMLVPGKRLLFIKNRTFRNLCDITKCSQSFLQNTKCLKNLYKRKNKNKRLDLSQLGKRWVLNTSFCGIKQLGVLLLLLDGMLAYLRLTFSNSAGQPNSSPAVLILVLWVSQEQGKKKMDFAACLSSKLPVVRLRAFLEALFHQPTVRTIQKSLGNWVMDKIH